MCCLLQHQAGNGNAQNPQRWQSSAALTVLHEHIGLAVGCKDMFMAFCMSRTIIYAQAGIDPREMLCRFSHCDDACKY